MFELVIWCRLFISLLVLVYKFDHMPLLQKSRKILTCSVKIVKNYKKKNQCFADSSSKKVLSVARTLLLFFSSMPGFPFSRMRQVTGLAERQ